jgi:hypothetical protein
MNVITLFDPWCGMQQKHGFKLLYSLALHVFSSAPVSFKSACRRPKLPGLVIERAPATFSPGRYSSPARSDLLRRYRDWSAGPESSSGSAGESQHRASVRKPTTCNACGRRPNRSAGISSTRQSSGSSPTRRNERRNDRRFGRTPAQKRATIRARTFRFTLGGIADRKHRPLIRIRSL